MRLALAAALVALALPLGCAYGDHSPASLSYTYISATGSSAVMSTSSDSAPRPHAELGVLARPASASDALGPHDARHSGFLFWEHLTPHACCPAPGHVQLGKARRLLTGVGPRGASLFAAPTANGWVCYGLAGDNTARCEERLDHGLALLIDDRDGPGGVPVYLFGLAADSVQRIGVDVGGRVLAAKVDRNAFALTLPSAGTPARQIHALVVTRQDGRRERLPLDWSWG